MLGILEYLIDSTAFNDVSGVHDCYSIAGLCDDTQVMSDKQD
jgi:hypothetical protein